MENPWKAKILVFNKNNAENKKKAEDLITLLSVIPKGQLKQLFKIEECASILSKYGITVPE